MAEKEYIERGAAYPLAKKICDAFDSDEFQRLNFGMRILDWIDDIPAADVRPVVLCRECEYWKQWDNTTHYLCTYVAGEKFIRNAEDFCSRGEKREES